MKKAARRPNQPLHARRDFEDDDGLDLDNFIAMPMWGGAEVDKVRREQTISTAERAVDVLRKR